MQVFAAYFVVTIIVVVWSWFFMVAWLFRRLRKRHPATYEAIGSPSLFWNNSMRNGWLLLKFLFSSKPQELGDPVIRWLARLMRIFLVVYPFFFLGIVAVGFIAARHR